MLKKIIPFSLILVIFLPVAAVAASGIVHVFGHAVALWGVDYIPQVYPGDWSKSQNSGQAALLTVFNYYKDNWYTRNAQSEIPKQISWSNDWLADYYWECVSWYGKKYCYRDENGAPVDLWQLEALAEGHWGRNAYASDSASEMSLYTSLRDNKPIIVRVRKDMKTYGRFVWMVVIGMESSVGVWVNDPSDPNGKHKWYGLEQFRASWKSAGKWALFVD